MMLTPSEWSALRVSLVVAAGALALAYPPGLLMGWLLARRRFPGRLLVEIIVFLPLVLPPIITGFFLLVLFGRHGVLGAPLLRWTGIDIVFTIKGMALASAAVAFPLVVRSVRASIESVDAKLEQAAATLGYRPARVFWTVTVPLAWPGLLAGAILGFARAVGEFGATRIVALNMDGSRTLALEAFQLLETPGTPMSAILRIAAISIVLSATALALCELLARRWKAAMP
ncbi:MAG TPA: molybdate ABC transporter permease subunit [Kiritimatiellia bacterium]|nr:molybdate ABC transporter permease subunit [Kiritimatiellia bacterium]